MCLQRRRNKAEEEAKRTTRSQSIAKVKFVFHSIVDYNVNASEIIELFLEIIVR